MKPEVSAQRLQGHHWEQGRGFTGAHGLYKGHGVTASQPGVEGLLQRQSQSSEPTVLVSRWVTVLKGLCCDQEDPPLPSQLHSPLRGLQADQAPLWTEDSNRAGSGTHMGTQGEGPGSPCHNP